MEDLRSIVKFVRDRSFPYRHREEKERNWHWYDQAHVNEIADVLETISDVVNIASSRIPRKRMGEGRPPVPSSDIVKVMLMQAYFGTPNLVAEGFLRLFGEKLGISSEFLYKTIERGYDPHRTREILDESLRIMNEAGNPLEKIFSTDGTGDPGTMKVNYESKRSQQKMEREKGRDKKDSDAFPHTMGKHDFQYSSFSVGVHTKIISGFSTTDDHSTGELSPFPDVMAQTVGLYPQMEVMLGDALYSNRKICSIVDGYGITPYFLPKANATFRANGVASWKAMRYRFLEETQPWMEQYHMRSISESVNSMMKRKRTEESLKINTHNLRQYCYLRHTDPDMIRDYRELYLK
ncbi:MAG: transposase [Thermoplasmataceae archaeon]